MLGLPQWNAKSFRTADSSGTTKYCQEAGTLSIQWLSPPLTTLPVHSSYRNMDELNPRPPRLSAGPLCLLRFGRTTQAAGSLAGPAAARGKPASAPLRVSEWFLHHSSGKAKIRSSLVYLTYPSVSDVKRRLLHKTPPDTAAMSVSNLSWLKKKSQSVDITAPGFNPLAGAGKQMPQASKPPAPKTPIIEEDQNSTANPPKHPSRRSELKRFYTIGELQPFRARQYTTSV
ncbi:PREDICTED: LOW QUALITY PROTEIN: uncharacterized protein LOC107546008 [Miniopterus natalensis]|uniref:LOW QUALITY PROTEIN: uncharacterized protein LOC107546008 n=1 Tax=Miniopterus natalensis TaxID=291302 RepID=UPI0007A70195|nr:PREDICTED: LOW QUALITY PROTEIN: uncharacterized protein LOC107546008 [Miniopterus natalensis]